MGDLVLSNGAMKLRVWETSTGSARMGATLEFDAAKVCELFPAFKAIEGKPVIRVPYRDESSGKVNFTEYELSPSGKQVKEKNHQPDGIVEEFVYQGEIPFQNADGINMAEDLKVNVYANSNIGKLWGQAFGNDTPVTEEGRG